MIEELTLTEVKHYYHAGSVWVVSKDRLYQVDGNLFEEWMPGNEMYGFLMRKFSKSPPLPRSIAKEKIHRLRQLLDTLM